MGNRIYTYLTLITGISILLAFAGIQTGVGFVLETFNVINAPENATLSTFFDNFSAIFIAGALGAIAVGFLLTRSPESYLLLGFVLFLAAFVADFASVITYMQGTFPDSWVTYVITAIYGVFIVGYLLSLIDWWRAAD